MLEGITNSKSKNKQLKNKITMTKEQKSNSKAERIVISQSVKRVKRPKGSATHIYTEQVVYKTKVGVRTNGKPAYHSETRHEQYHPKKSN